MAPKLLSSFSTWNEDSVRFSVYINFIVVMSVTLSSQAFATSCSTYLSLEDLPINNGGYVYYLNKVGQKADTKTYLYGLPKRTDHPGFDDPNFIENLSSYREDVDPKGRGLVSFDLERTVYTEQGREEFSVMLTASYTMADPVKGPTLEEFSKIASILPGFHRMQNANVVAFENRDKNIFLTWIRHENLITIGAININHRRDLEGILTSELNSVLEAFEILWPERRPNTTIVNASIAAARASNMSVIRHSRMSSISLPVPAVE
jgi:hypothetical protein